MHDDTQLQQIFEQAQRLDAAAGARLIGLLVEQVPWGRLARDEQRALHCQRFYRITFGLA